MTKDTNTSSKELERQAKKHSKALKSYGKQGMVREKVPLKNGPQQGNFLEISGKNTLQNTTFEQNKQSVQAMEKAFAISKEESTHKSAKMQQNNEPVLAIEGAFDISKHEQSKKEARSKLETKKKHSTISLKKDNVSKLALTIKDSAGSIRNVESSSTDSLYESESDDESSFSESENDAGSKTPVLVVKEKEEIHEIEPPRDRNEVYFTDDQHTAASLCFMTWLHISFSKLPCNFLD